MGALLAPPSPAEVLHAPVSGLPEVDYVLILEQPLLRLPVDELRAQLKAQQRLCERDFVHSISQLETSAKERPETDSTRDLAPLDEIVHSVLVRLRGLQTKMEAFGMQADEIVDSMQSRSDHIVQLQTMSLASRAFDDWCATRLDRLVVEYLLRSGCTDSAAHLAKKQRIEALVDLPVFAQIQEIEESLVPSSPDTMPTCAKALVWCSENKVALRRAKSTLEFDLRLQELVEHSRDRSAHARRHAVLYARKHLVPYLAAAPRTSATFTQSDAGELNGKSSAVDVGAQAQRALGLLACGPSHYCYSDLYKRDRWDLLRKRFRAIALQVYDLPPAPLMHIALSAGLSSLKSLTCYSHDRASPPRTTERKSPLIRHGDRHPDCPVCQEGQLGTLARQMPRSHFANSVLICRMTGKVMDDTNPPMCLPNGMVYSAELNSSTVAPSECKVDLAPPGSTYAQRERGIRPDLVTNVDPNAPWQMYYAHELPLAHSYFDAPASRQSMTPTPVLTPGSHVSCRAQSSGFTTPMTSSWPRVRDCDAPNGNCDARPTAVTWSDSSRLTSPTAPTECSSADADDGGAQSFVRDSSNRTVGTARENNAGEPSHVPLELAGGVTIGHFGPGVRSKLGDVLPILLRGIPTDTENPAIYIAEYGCLGSRSMHLLRLIMELFARRTCADAEEDSGGPDLSFMVIHEDSSQGDFRSFLHLLNTHPDSYMNPLWQSAQKQSLQNAIFPSLAARPFGSRVVPPSSLHFGLSLMDMHWTHTPNAPGVSLVSTAHAELALFLNARAHEFKQGGVFVMAYLARSEPDVSESDSTGMALDGTSRTPDIWASMNDMLVPCLQRLVSCGMFKSDVARLLLTLPLHPRTPMHTLRVLQDLEHLWAVDWSCGLGSTAPLQDANGGSASVLSEPQPLRLPQPAWMALQAGEITHTSYVEHLINMFKNVYEPHFRLVLRERGKLSKGAVEFVLDTLWDVLQSRMDDPDAYPLSHCELEVQLIALRRR
ncbi:hypothetical protein MSPP1_000888 [Malassezia sp. CBS 17886]|nr:hypothetical protein MSPP1_000888 [Malassezia sp. CBS 17886]